MIVKSKVNDSDVIIKIINELMELNNFLLMMIKQ
jgi:hypothetical protein